MTRPQYIGRTSESGEQVWVVATPHFLDDWELERYGKHESKPLTALLGSWKSPKMGFYMELLDAPLNQTMYAVIRKKQGLKPYAFLYFRNIVNDIRRGRRELELISVTPPNHSQTDGINYQTFHDHKDTEKWSDIHYTV